MTCSVWFSADETETWRRLGFRARSQGSALGFWTPLGAASSEYTGRAQAFLAAQVPVRAMSGCRVSEPARDQDAPAAFRLVVTER